MRLRRDKAASAPHRGEESTWNELTEHHRPVRVSAPDEFTAGPHERLLAICAPYSLCRRDPWDRLACSDLDGTRTMLSLDWGVCSRADRLYQLHCLITSGHRTSFDAERARLEKDAAVCAKDVAKFEKKLSNPGFLAKAAPEIIEKDRARLAELKAKAELIEAQIADLP